MKKIIFSSIIIFLLFFCYSCRKAKEDYNDYLPKVKTLSATIQIDGSVTLTGELESEGDADVKYIGFCCGTKNPPEMTDRQIICSLQNSTFSATYPQLSNDSSYHFRAWATNKYGYSYSNTLTLDSIIVPQVVAPCTNTNETVNTGASFGAGSYYGGPHAVVWNYTYSAYTISANTSGGSAIDINIYLHAPLTQGIYTTIDNSSPGYREMYFTFTQGSFFALKAGTSIYVNTISPGVFDLAVCDAPWKLTNSATLFFNTRLTAHN